MKHTSSLFFPAIAVTLILMISLLFTTNNNLINAAAAPPSVKRVVAWDAHHYVHMTMITKINSTFFLMSFQSSPIGEGSPTQELYLIKSYDAGLTWSSPPQVVVTTNGKYPVWGPALFFIEDQNRLLMYYSQSVPQNIRITPNHYLRHFPGGDICVIESLDHGESWSEKRTLLKYDDDVFGYGNVSKMTANAPIFLSADKRSFALPFWAEPHYPSNLNDTGKQTAGLIVTTDGGKTYQAVDHSSWNASRSFGIKSWLIENFVIPTSPLAPLASDAPTRTSLQQGFRTELGFMLSTTTMVNERNGDDGYSTGFAPSTYTSIPNPDSKVSATAIYSKEQEGMPSSWLLSCNPTFDSRLILGVFRGSLMMKNKMVEFDNTPLVILENSTKYESDYPTIIPGVKENQALVSYSCLSHTAACFSTIEW